MTVNWITTARSHILSNLCVLYYYYHQQDTEKTRKLSNSAIFILYYIIYFLLCARHELRTKLICICICTYNAYRLRLVTRYAGNTIVSAKDAFKRHFILSANLGDIIEIHPFLDNLSQNQTPKIFEQVPRLFQLTPKVRQYCRFLDLLALLLRISPPRSTFSYTVVKNTHSVNEITLNWKIEYHFTV